MRWVEPTVQQVRETLRRQEDRLCVTLFGTSAPYGEVDVSYADDLLPQERWADGRSPASCTLLPALPRT